MNIITIITIIIITIIMLIFQFLCTLWSTSFSRIDDIEFKIKSEYFAVIIACFPIFPISISILGYSIYLNDALMIKNNKFIVFIYLLFLIYIYVCAIIINWFYRRNIVKE
jgi:hypothetical protein